MSPSECSDRPSVFYITQTNLVVGLPVFPLQDLICTGLFSFWSTVRQMQPPRKPPFLLGISRPSTFTTDAESAASGLC
jgi:hypothetical protein